MNNHPSAVPAKYNSPTLLKKDADDLFDYYYRHMLESLGKHCKHIADGIRLYQTSSAATIQNKQYGDCMVTA